MNNLKEIECALSYDIDNRILKTYLPKNGKKFNYQDIAVMLGKSADIFLRSKSPDKKYYIFEDNFKRKKCSFEVWIPINLLDVPFDDGVYEFNRKEFSFKGIVANIKAISLLCFKGFFLSNKSWQKIYDFSKAEIEKERRSKNG